MVTVVDVVVAAVVAAVVVVEVLLVVLVCGDVDCLVVSLETMSLMSSITLLMMLFCSSVISGFSTPGSPSQMSLYSLDHFFSGQRSRQMSAFFRRNFLCLHRSSSQSGSSSSSSSSTSSSTTPRHPWRSWQGTLGHLCSPLYSLTVLGQEHNLNHLVVIVAVVVVHHI